MTLTNLRVATCLAVAVLRPRASSVTRGLVMTLPRQWQMTLRDNAPSLLARGRVRVMTLPRQWQMTLRDLPPPEDAPSLLARSQ